MLRIKFFHHLQDIEVLEDNFSEAQNSEDTNVQLEDKNVPSKETDESQNPKDEISENSDENIDVDIESTKKISPTPGLSKITEPTQKTVQKSIQTPKIPLEKSTITTTTTTVKTTSKSDSKIFEPKIIEPEIVKPEIIEPNDNEIGLIVATSDLENEDSEKRGHKDVAIEFSKSGIDWEKICNSRERYKNNELRRVCEVFRSVVTEKPDFEVNRIERSSPAIPVGAPEPGQAIKGKT